MSIEVKNLLKTYGEQKAVDNISFSLNRGEIVGFLGPNGAGKSTSMKIISGFLQPDSGTATVCGIDVLKDPGHSKQKIGYLPESNALYYDMYVREYLDFIADVHRVKNKKTSIENVITIAGLGAESKKKIGQLSKGYKQRVGLAAALVHEPEVLILDEPTTGLDPNQIIEIREVIKGLGKNKTVLFSSHILSEVEAICDRVIIINKGILVADDSLQNLQQKNSGATSVTVQFDKPANPDLFRGISNATILSSDSDREIRFSTKNADALKKQLLELSLSHNLNIVSLHTGEQKLEEVFRQLTGNKTDTVS